VHPKIATLRESIIISCFERDRNWKDLARASRLGVIVYGVIEV
jgi:hypothetical protein